MFSFHFNTFVYTVLVVIFFSLFHPGENLKKRKSCRDAHGDKLSGFSRLLKNQTKASSEGKLRVAMAKVPSVVAMFKANK